MFPTPDRYFDMPADKRRHFVQTSAAQMAPAIGGRVDWNRDGDLTIEGAYYGRPVSIVIMLSFATMLLSLKMPREIPNLGFDGFKLDVDPHPGRGERAPNRHYLTPSVYIEGSQNERETTFGRLQRLPPPAQAALVGALSQFDRGFFSAMFESMTLMCPARVVLSPQSAQSLAYYVNMLFLLSNDADAAWSA